MTLHLKDNVRRRAVARLAEIHAELAQIYRAFPELRRSAGATMRASSLREWKQPTRKWQRRSLTGSEPLSAKERA